MLPPVVEEAASVCAAMPVTTAPPVVIQATGLTKRFGARLAVEDLSLAVRAGEILGLLGPRGAGKSTALLMIAGVVQPDLGLATILGRAVTAGGNELRTHMGICPQSAVLSGSLSCLGQLDRIGQIYDVPAAMARRRSVDLLAAVGLTEQRDVLARDLTPGMRRRLNLIMALVHNPDVVLLDEPEAGLDPQSRVLMREFIHAMAPAKTVLITTANPEEADRVCDRVALLDRGRVLAIESPTDLKRRFGPGDVLELELAGASPAAAQRAVAACQPIAADLSVTGDSLVIRARGVIDVLPQLLQALRAANIRPSEVRLRQSNLADVFAALSGRRLRD